MPKLNTLVKVFKKPKKVVRILGDKGILNWVPDKIYLKLVFWAETNKKLNLERPQYFNEKLQWLKLYNRRSEYSTYSDKYAVRSYIKDNIGKEYLIPLIEVYKSVEEIDWDLLPNSFVLKCTHGSGANIICPDKSNLNIKEAKKKIKKWMKKNWYYFGREWPYMSISPKIICEKYMTENNNQQRLTDYKFYCFNGLPMYCQVIRNRGKNETIDFYDREWNHMTFNGLRNLPQSKNNHGKPKEYEKMIGLAQKLAKDFPFVRVDLYYISGNIYIGELTFFPTSGFGKFYPEEWNKIIGDLLILPKNKI
ncbi:MAG: ATP-grasp fold amidoligase family protein [bacterium]